jgi:ribokinase
MAARLGAAVSLVARVGRDLFGRDMVENFRAEGIDTTHVTPTDGVSTGTAVITVDAAGRNTIVVAPGANGLLTAADVDAARGVIESAGVLICQQEVPAAATLAALRIASATGVRVVFNPAPAGGMPVAHASGSSPGMPTEAYPLCDVLCPNETEAAALTGLPTGTRAEAEAAARDLMRRGARSVVVTLGERGCLVVTPEGVAELLAPRVQAVDTTGAGDAFIGSLAYFLGGGAGLVEAARRANQIAAISVQTAGTQASFPRAAELRSDEQVGGVFREPCRTRTMNTSSSVGRKNTT